ncbi:6234_t:CDS:2 [Entrophospora sp. SA101]|nr:6234_t:CDS:2 [Entrophospora sp. SA101]
MIFDPFLMQSYFGWLIGLSAMVRKTKVSNILKIIFNIGGLLRNAGQLWFIVVPVDVTIIECKLASYFLPIANVIYKSALVAFLLWRLRQIESIKLDVWLAPPIVGIESTVNYDVGNESFRCSSDIEHNKVSIIGALVFDTRNSKGSLFTTVMYWNFIRVFLAIISDVIVLSYTLLGFYEDNDLDHAFIEGNIQTVLYICLSYFITADVEIVKVVESKKKVPSGSARNDISTKGNMSEISLSNRTSNQSLASVQFASKHYELSEAEQKNSDDIDEGKVAIVSMKKLSFTECANLVLDGRSTKENNKDTDDYNELYDNEGNKIDIEVIDEEVTDNNFGLIKAISQIWQLVVPNDVTEGQCIALTSLVVTGIFIYRTALQGFLLWRLKGIDNKKMDLWIGSTLFTARIAQFFQIRPTVVYDDEEDAHFCNQGLDLARTQVLGYISIDLLIECYVTFRFMQILTKANETALLLAGESREKKRRTLFTAIIYWNFLRLFLAISQSAMFVGWTISGIYRSNDKELAIYINNTQILLLIGLSYAITIDAEIVRVIEGRRPSILSKSFKGVSRSSRNAQVPNKNNQSFQTSSSETSNNAITVVESFDNTDDDKIIFKEENQNPSVNKGSSFYEWGKVVTDKKSTKEYDGLIINEDETKEPSVNITSNDAIIIREDQGIVNEGETKEPSVNITSNDAIINREDQGIVNEGETKEPSVNITSNDAIIIREDQGIVNEGEIKEPSVNITSNDAIIIREDQGIVNEGETKEPSVNTTNNDAIIIREDQGIVNEGETKEPSVNTTSNDAIINQENSAINKTSESTDIV